MAMNLHSNKLPDGVLLQTGLQTQGETYWVCKCHKEEKPVHIYLVFSREGLWKHKSNRSDA